MEIKPSRRGGKRPGAGRPHGSHKSALGSLIGAAERLRALVPKVIQRLAEIILDPKTAEADAIRAAEVLLDRALPRLAVLKTTMTATDPEAANQRWLDRVATIRAMNAPASTPKAIAEANDSNRPDRLNGDAEVGEISPKQ